MIILDTDVLSELMRAVPNAAVTRWAANQVPTMVFASAVTAAELYYGVALLPDGKRRAAFMNSIEAMLNLDFRGPILPFDMVAAPFYAEIAATRRAAGRPISQADAQIAAITRSCGARLATRNVADFAGCGIDVIDPWLAEDPQLTPAGASRHRCPRSRRRSSRSRW